MRLTGQGLAVIGAGAWGTALAIHAARAGHAPRLWVYEPDLLALLREARENPWFLPGIRLPEAVRPVGSLAEAAAEAELVLVAVPSHVVRRVAADLGPHLAPGAALLSAAKGIEEVSHAQIGRAHV